MFGRRYREIMDRLAELSMTAAKLEARVRDLEFAAAAPKPEPEKRPDAANDETGDLLEKRILEGLNNLLAYEGRAGDKG